MMRQFFTKQFYNRTEVIKLKDLKIGTMKKPLRGKADF